MRVNIFMSISLRRINLIAIKHAQRIDSIIIRYFDDLKMLKLFLILLYVRYSFSKLTVDNFAKKGNYFASLLNKNRNNDTIGIINSFTMNCVDFDVITTFPLIVANDGHNFTRRSSRIKKIYVFLKDLSSFRKTLDEMDFYYIFDVNGKYYFFVCAQLENENWINEIVELIWKHSIMNFVLIYNSTMTNIIGYNPFNRTILNFTNSLYTDHMLFPDKLSNMYGYEMKVTIYDDWPKNVYQNGKLYGLDGNMLNIILETHNATAKFYYFKTMIEAITHLIDRQSDFIFIGVPGIYIYDIFQYSDATMMDDIIVLVPRSIAYPNHFTIVHIFKSKTTWIIYGLTWICLLSVMCLIKKLDRTGTENVNKTIFEIFSMHLAVAIPYFHIKLDSKKVFLLFILFAGTIFQSLFNSALLGIFITPKNRNDMKTLNELENSKMPIYIDAIFEESAIFFNPFITNFVNSTQTNITHSLRNLKKDGAYALTESSAHTFADNFENYIEMNRRFTKTYVKLEEHLIPALKVYLFPHKSPYISIVNNIIRINQEYMLNNKMKLTSDHKNHKKHFKVLRMHHMVSSFYMLAFGLLLAITAFIMEVVSFKLKVKFRKLKKQFHTISAKSVVQFRKLADPKHKHRKLFYPEIK